jgi:hypothetical protein
MADDVSELLTAERPKLVTGNRASYSSGTVRLPEDAAIDIKNRSYSLVAEVETRTAMPKAPSSPSAGRRAATRS